MYIFRPGLKQETVDIKSRSLPNFGFKFETRFWILLVKTIIVTILSGLNVHTYLVSL